MNERVVRQLWWVTSSVVVIATLLAWRWGRGMAIGVLAGGLWNLVSLWCLAQLLRAWLGPQPSRRRAIAWLLVKFPLLYVVIFRVFQSPGVSVLGFGIGFTVVLGVSLAWWLWQAQRMRIVKAHGS